MAGVPEPDRRLRLPDPLVQIDGRRVRASSLLGYAGAYQLTLSTALPELGTELHSSYLGHPEGEAWVAHLVLAPEAAPAITSRLVSGAELPVADDRRRCLYDHLAQLHEHLVEITAGAVQVELADRALELLDTA